MAVVLDVPFKGNAVGASYTGGEEAWLLGNGYAHTANEKAVLTGTANAVNIVTGGNLVAKINGVQFTAALAAADTPAAAATKIQTAAAAAVASSTSSVVSSKLTISSPGTGGVKPQTVEIVSGTGTVLANLGLAVGQSATTSKVNMTGGTPASDPTLASNREEPWDNVYAFGANESLLAARAHYIDTVAAEPDTNELPAAGGTVVRVYGDNFTGATAVNFGGTAGTSFSVVDDNTVQVTTPAKAAGSYDVVVVKAAGNATLTAAVKYI